VAGSMTATRSNDGLSGCCGSTAITLCCFKIK
jgi:hypothetical protein